MLKEHQNMHEHKQERGSRLMRRIARPLALAALAALSSMAIVRPAAALDFDLSRYSLSATHALPDIEAAEASAVTWNWNTGTLFVLGDEGDALVEVDRQGRRLSAMTLTGFHDTEGLTYIGTDAGGTHRFVVLEERLQTGYLLSYGAGTSIDRAQLDSAVFGPTVGNIGLEGLSWDPRDGSFVAVKEKTPSAVLSMNATFGSGAAPAVSALFDPAGLGVADLADVQVLSTFAALSGSASADHLLLLSQESPALLQVDRSGRVLARLDLSGVAGDIEGVTIGSDGTLYLVGETPALYVLSAAPVPEPSTWALMAAGLGALGLQARRRQRR
ncbi:MAG: SdiA-regulated domain-containing protein [Sphaerotilus natans subsp. sulfidivorans]|uniref:SdiA-regulated domain-containing protein n=1 Tax=Sphaerotilus sulfidivorans TaxID=639200 RepID=UPI002354E692|nr:SdiA-regulated domain-containing protein [Sphaerotilus sulfidivorans]MCK6403875.1 SdiA-regulated domain-containing protein [Sphaerotilus sulfidivorans]